MFLEHVNLTVSDVARSIRFYCDLFGFDVRWQGQTSRGTDAAHVGTDKYYIALFGAVRATRFERDYAEVGINHLGFVVDDLSAIKERLATLGVEPHSEEDYEPGRRLYFEDPDGIEVELVEYDA